MFSGPEAKVLKTHVGSEGYIAPEINGIDPYAGPPQDIFALGQILFMLNTTSFAFVKPLDAHYKRLHRDAARAMAVRKMTVDADLLDLVVGMTKQKVGERFTLE